MDVRRGGCMREDTWGLCRVRWVHGGVADFCECRRGGCLEYSRLGVCGVACEGWR
jgi:hypothetical protein